MFQKARQYISSAVSSVVHKFQAVVGAVLGGSILTLGLASPSHALGLDLSTVTLDTAPVFTLAIIVIAALASLWPIRKSVKLINRS